MTTSIVHLAPHYGGGVGTVVRALIPESLRQGGFRHRLAALEPVSAQMRLWATGHGIELIDGLHENDEALLRLLSEADIVQMHWWHHPLLNALMHRPDLPAFRCVIWSHVNGHHVPQNFPIGLADYADTLVLASPWSLEAPALTDAIRAGRPIEVIQSSAGAPPMPERRPRTDKHFRIGYVGTVDPIKMHPDFIHLCLAAEIPDARFVVAGGPRHEALQQAVNALGVAERFEILGPVDDVPALLATFDVFGYPLNPEHYGTGEQVLIEAMAAGVVPVVLDGGSERFTVEHERTGLVCRSAADYPSALHRLADNPGLVAQLSHRTQELAAKRFAIDKVVTSWHSVYTGATEYARRKHQLPQNSRPAAQGCRSAAVDLILDSVADTPVAKALSACLPAGSETLHTAPTEPRLPLPIGLFSTTRGTPFHYRQFYPDDEILAALCRCIEKHKPDTSSVHHTARQVDSRAAPPSRPHL